jgi:hypothetical protein
MDGNKLYKERTLPCLNELYAASECVDGKTYTWDQIFEYSPYMEEEGKKMIPTGAFYIDRKKYDEIVEKYSKRLPYYWRFPYRSEIYPKGEEWEELQRKYRENPEDEEIKKEYLDTVEFMRRDQLWEDYHKRLCDIQVKKDAKEIDAKEAKKQCDALAKEFNCQHRSRERESIQFTCAFYGPTIVRRYFDKVKKYYNGLAPEGTDHSLAKSDAEAFSGFEKNIKSWIQKS